MTSYARIVLLVCGLLMSGCAEYATWHGRTFYGVDCSPEVVQTNNGKCVYLNKEKVHADKARP